MDYKLTFQDGSKALMHYGVKGMKWGVLSPETQERYRREGIDINMGAGAAGYGYRDETEEERKEREAKEAQEKEQAETKKKLAQWELDDPEGYAKWKESEKQKAKDRVTSDVQSGDVYAALRDAAHGSNNEKEFTSNLASAAVSAAANSDAGKKAKQEVDKLLSNAEKASELMKKGDQLSDSEREALREKVRAEQREKKKKKAKDRDEALSRGDFIGFLSNL